MKMVYQNSIRAMVVAGLTIVSVRGVDVSDFPGQCENSTYCHEEYNNKFACVSVDTNTAGLEMLNMCTVAQDFCSGKSVGSCPTFTSWPSKYQEVQPVCAFVPVDDCNEVLDLNDKVVIDAAGSGDKISCYSASMKIEEENIKVNGTYKCVDADKYTSGSGNIVSTVSDSIADGCAGEATNGDNKLLCNGHGTCVPSKVFGTQYECRCQAGYDISDKCLNVVSSECTTLSQCGAKGKCEIPADKITGTCTCEEGTTGDQCDKCDDKSVNACDGHGTCKSGVCECDAGFVGDFCTEEDESNSAVNQDGQGSNSNPAARAKDSESLMLKMVTFTLFLVTLLAFK